MLQATLTPKLDGTVELSIPGKPSTSLLVPKNAFEFAKALNVIYRMGILHAVTEIGEHMKEIIR